MSRETIANSDPRSTPELVEAAVAETNDERHWELIGILRARGTKTEFHAAIELISSDDPQRRAIGASVLGQLGWETNPFLEESIDALLPLLSDLNYSVILSAGHALGSIRSLRAVPELLKLVDHPNEHVRFSITGALAIEDPLAVDGLIRLTQDVDEDVRNWATFGLGSLVTLDSEQIRAALLARLEETESEIRGEALVGLANRHDPRAVELIKAELAKPVFNSLVFDAVLELMEPSFLPILIELKQSLREDTDELFVADLETVIQELEQAPLIEA